MLEVEVIGTAAIAAAEVERLASLAAASAGVEDGHVAVEFVDGDRIRELNREHRGKDAPTDVLSFPIDEDGRRRAGRRASSATSSSRPSTPRTCARRSSTACCT